MTMGDESLFGALALPVVMIPILEKLEMRDMAAAQTLRAAFAKVEHQYPGFTYDLVKGVIRQANLLGPVDMTECFLRLEGINNSDEFKIARSEDCFRDLNTRSSNLKRILSRIPDEIYDRKKFLETIKDIASAIKNLLDAVNNVFPYVEGAGSRQSLEQKKRDFVKHSKRFSNTLKEFFKDNQRGLNPPHRVKSISMTSFTPEEMEFLKARGNEFCRRVWLGLYDSRNHIELDTKDENKRRDFMTQKYEKKRYYVAPTEQMHEEARTQNTPTPKEEQKPLRSLAGNMPKLVVGGAAAQPVAPQSRPAPAQMQAPPQPAATKTNAMDLLSDLGGDPFAAQTAQAQSNGSNFADFGAFGGPPQQQQQNAFNRPNAAQVPMTASASFDTGFAANFAAPPAAGPTSAPTSSLTTPSGDKYAALTELVDSTSAPPQTVSWDGSSGGGGGGISWGDSLSSSQSSGTGLFGSSGGAGAGVFGGGGVSAAPPTSGVNPFGGGGAPAGQGQMPGQMAANPFGAPPASAAPPQAGMFGAAQSGGFPAAAPGGFPAGAPSMFPATQSAPFSQPPPTGGAAFGGSAGFAQFGQQTALATSAGKPTAMPGMAQNGGWGAAPAQNGRSGAQGFGAFGMSAGGGAMPATGGWGQQPQQANPFMGGFPPQQTGIPQQRPTNPTNPFL